MRALAIEMFKVSNNYSNSLMCEIFDKRNNVYDIRNPFEFARPNVQSVFSGTESISFLGPKIWDIVATRIFFIRNRFIRNLKLCLKRSNYILNLNEHADIGLKSTHSN